MINLTHRQAQQYRAAMIKGSEILTDEEALQVPMLYAHWREGQEYEVNQRLFYNDKLYRVIIAHTSQASWTPDVSSGIFAEVLIPDPSIIPEWIQPDSTNPYMQGDKVTHNDKTWISDIDNNVWEPGVYGWSEVTE